MPIVNGHMYAEIHGLAQFDELKILILGDITDDLATFCLQTDTLHTYISATLGLKVRISLHCTDMIAEGIAGNLGITRHKTDVLTEDTLQVFVKNSDIDVVFDQNAQLSNSYIQKHFFEFQVVDTFSSLTASCEDFLVGHSIIWLFSNPSWNTPVFMRYLSRPGIHSDYFSFMGECTSTKNYSSTQQERVRYISNRLSQIEYSKDNINYHLKRMRKAERNGLPDNGNLELNYHLGNYYFLIAGVLDSIARLINDVYRLGFTSHRDLAIEKTKFIEANRRKRTGFVRILTNKAFINWLSFLKERRNFIAHDGDMRQSPIVEQNKNPLTEEKVEQLIDQKMDWIYMASIFPAEVLRALREQTGQMIRLEHDYKVIAKNVMVIPNLRTGGIKLYQPLRGIEHDYEKLCDVMEKLLNRLRM